MIHVFKNAEKVFKKKTKSRFWKTGAGKPEQENRSRKTGAGKSSTEKSGTVRKRQKKAGMRQKKASHKSEIMRDFL